MALEMRATLALMATCVALVAADAVVTVQTEGGMSRGTMVQRVYTLDRRGGTQVVGLIQRFGSDERGAMATDFFRPIQGDPFENMIMDQGMGFPSPLEAIVGNLMQLTQAMLRPPCPHMQQAQLNGPGALSYMARSRFGPSYMGRTVPFGDRPKPEDEDDSDDYEADTMTEDEEPAEVTADLGEDEEDSDASDDADTDFFSASLLAPEDAQWAAEEPSGERWRALGASWLPASQANAGDKDMDRRTALFFAPREERFVSFDDMGPPVFDAPRWSFQTEEGEVNWDFLVFLMLCGGCGALAFAVARSFCKWSRLRCQGARRCRRAQFMTRLCHAHSCEGELAKPLLEPLGPEGAVFVPAPTALFNNVEVASEHAPKGPEYVTIAYVPLKSEEQH
eukprot:jgi/Botrbrau1/700/Bobra.160_2s0023.1